MRFFCARPTRSLHAVTSLIRLGVLGCGNVGAALVKLVEAHMKAMKQELEWVRQGAKARQSKSKARLARYEEMTSVEYQKRNETQEIFIPPGDRAGGQGRQRTAAEQGRPVRRRRAGRRADQRTDPAAAPRAPRA